MVLCNKISSPQALNQRGFSLIEVSIALIVIALLMLPIIATYNLYIENRKLSITDSVLTITRASILKYYEKNGVYPTPANPSIAQGAGGFGLQRPGPWPACDVASTTVCQTPNTGFGTGVVLIGDIPFATLGIPYKTVLDGYGKKLKYAVTLSQTILPFNNANGAIEVLNDAGNSIYLTPATPRSHFVVMSHGQNGMGAFTLGGVRFLPCTLGTTESENCNNDGIFRSNVNALGRVVIFDVAGATQFDDYLKTTNTSSYGLWNYIPKSGLNMESRSGANILIGNCSTNAAGQCRPPSAHIDVDGSVNATIIRTARLCPSGEGRCIDNPLGIGSNNPRTTAGGVNFVSPRMLTGAPVVQPPDVAPYPLSAEGGTSGAGIRCYNNNGLRGIRSADEICSGNAPSGNTSAARFPSASIDGARTCPIGQNVRGLESVGRNQFRLICG